MKSLVRILGLTVLFFLSASAYAQSSGPSAPPPPVCSASTPGAIYTQTGTTPPTVYTCSYYNLAWQWVANPSYGGLVYYPTLPSTCAGSLPAFLAGWPNTAMYVCVSGTPSKIGGYGAGVTLFSSPSGSWPSWLVPSVSSPGTTPTLSVSASTIPISAGGTGATDGEDALINLFAGAANCATSGTVWSPQANACIDAVGSWSGLTGGTQTGSGSAQLNTLPGSLALGSGTPTITLQNGSGTFSNALVAGSTNGEINAAQQQSPAGTGNNGIAMSLTECLSQTGACSIRAPAL